MGKTGRLGHDTKTTFAYDPVDQLISAVDRGPAPSNSVLSMSSYSYGLSGNRVSLQLDSVVNGFVFNNVNQVIQKTISGKVFFSGTLNESGTVTWTKWCRWRR
jgi:hypothetical protein